MTNEMKYLMYLYSCAARSERAVCPDYDVNFEELFSIAGRMSLLSMLSYALKLSPEIQCPAEIRSKLYSVMLGTSLKNKMKIDAILRVLDDLEREGIKAAVLKGLDCARYYSKPECRISADTDIYVEKKDEERIFSYFEQKGFTVKRREKHEHHGECESVETGLIEIHVKIWEDKIYGVMPRKIDNLNNCIKNSICVPVGGYRIRVLDPTSSMIFMTLHLVKHFVFSCANLKMSYDLALYYVNNINNIDKEKYKSWIKKSGYEKIVSAVFSSMVIYCGFSSEPFDDITSFDEKAGNIYAESIETYDSCNDDHRPNVSLMLQYCTNKSNAKRKGKGYAFLFNAKKVIVEKSKILFPKISHLKTSYPYLEKHPYFYLFACIHRFFDRGTKHVFHGNIENGSFVNYNKNLELQLSETEKKQIKALEEMKLL